MKTALLVLSAMTVAAIMLVAALQERGGTARAATPTTGVGGQISIGAPTTVGSTIHVPVSTTAPTDPYSGANITLTWDPALLSFSSVDTSGTTLSAAGSLLCLPAAYAGAGGTGELQSCSVIGGPSIALGGLLMTFILNQVASGCSNLHLVTLNAPDNGGSSFGTYTIDSASGNAQANILGPDVSVPVGAGTCATPTNTPTMQPTSTNTPTATATFTPTSSPTPTFTPVSGAPDVAIGIFASPTAANSGANVTYTVNVANLGNVAAQNVQVQITLPLGGVLLGEPTNVAGHLVGPCPIYVFASFYCPIGTLAPNNFVPGGPDEASFALPARLPYMLGNGPAVAMAVVSASNEPLANQGNNSASAGVAIVGCPDINGDNAVNALDLNILSNTWLKNPGDPGYNPLADIDGDGRIDAIDLNIMASHFNTFCVGLDSDHDGVSNYDEINVYHTCPGLQTQYQSLPACHVGGNVLNPLIPDPATTSGDGVPDGIAIFSYRSNPLTDDTSGDFYSDAAEMGMGKNPNVYCPVRAADITMDGAVNALDLNRLALAFGTTSSSPGFNPRADFNHDGGINGLDLNLMANVFGHFIGECP